MALLKVTSRFPKCPTRHIVKKENIFTATWSLRSHHHRLNYWVNLWVILPLSLIQVNQIMGTSLSVFTYFAFRLKYLTELDIYGLTNSLLKESVNSVENNWNVIENMMKNHHTVLINLNIEVQYPERKLFNNGAIKPSTLFVLVKMNFLI